MNDLYTLMNQKPQTPESVILAAYRLGRYFGQREAIRHTHPRAYDALCNRVANATAALVRRLRRLRLRALREDIRD